MAAELTASATRRRLRVRLGRAVAPVALGLGLALAPAAHAATVLHWDTPGRSFVNDGATPSQAGEMVTNVVLPAGYANRRCWPVLYCCTAARRGPNRPPRSG